MAASNKPAKSNSNFTRFIRNLDFTKLLSWNTILSNMLFLLFLTFLGMIYIGNTHIAERNIRLSNKMEKELTELRWEYMTLKSELMYDSKQSEVAKMVAKQGMKELTEPPKKIIANK